MDPGSAFALAVNVLAVITFCKDVAVVFHEVSERGSTAENADLETQSRRIKVESRVWSDQDITKTQDPVAIELHGIAKECMDSADALQKEIDELKKGNSFKRTFKTLRKKGDIERHERKLQRLQKTLDAFKLNRLSEQHASMLEQAVQANSKTSELLQLFERWKLEEKDRRLEEETESQRRRLLDSLWYPEINSRKNQIQPSPGTYEWIFEDEVSVGDSFSRFLRTDEHLYWIQGKPGSGKSCLMKSLYENKKTRKIIDHLDPARKPILLFHFFWLAGGPPQKNAMGLWFSLLHQLLEKSPRSILSRQDWRTFQNKKTNGDWELKELQNVFTRLVTTLEKPLYVFLDGLDEFRPDEDSLEIFRHLSVFRELNKSLSSTPPTKAHSCLKLIVSSRLEPAFRKELSNVPQIQMQALNSGDIEEVTKKRLRSIESIEEHQLEELVSIIARKADGVFIWVHYVLKNLVDSTVGGETWDERQRYLDQCPSGMSELYTQMWNRLNGDTQKIGSNREEAARYFRYAMREPRDHWSEKEGEPHRFPRCVFDFMVAADPKLQLKILKDQEEFALSEVIQRCCATEQRLLTRCASLLEISEVGHWEPPDCHAKESVCLKYKDEDLQRENQQLDEFAHLWQIDFIHRTALDFLKEDEEQRILSHFCPSPDEEALTDIRVNLIRMLLLGRKIVSMELLYTELKNLLVIQNLSIFTQGWDLISLSFQRILYARSHHSDKQLYKLSSWNFSIEKMQSCSYLPPNLHFAPRDLVGLALTNAREPSCIQALILQQGHGRPLKRQFANYLLLCTMGSFYFEEITAEELSGFLKIWDWLILNGADLNSHLFYSAYLSADLPEILGVAPWLTSSFWTFLERSLLWNRLSKSTTLLTTFQKLLEKGGRLDECWPVIVQNSAAHSLDTGLTISLTDDDVYRHWRDFKSTILVLEVSIEEYLYWYEKDFWMKAKLQKKNPHREVKYIARREESEDRSLLQWWRPSTEDAQLLLLEMDRCAVGGNDHDSAEDQDVTAFVAAGSRIREEAEFEDFKEKVEERFGPFEKLATEVISRSEDLGFNEEINKEFEKRGWRALRDYVAKPFQEFEDEVNTQA